MHPAAAPGRATTAIVRDGARLAVVSHERDILDDRALRHRIGSAALLAIDNERLAAELRAHLADLRASQRRIVLAADRTRQGIERDLHDGAQQRLLAVLYEIGLAGAGHDGLLDDARRALAELRDLAHGIFPAVLGDAGLEAALQTLADEADLVLRIGPMPGRRLPPETERTAYLVVAETAGPAALTVRARVRGDTLLLDVDGSPAPPSEYLADRLGAVRGRLTYEAGHLHAEIPCG